MQNLISDGIKMILYGEIEIILEKAIFSLTLQHSLIHNYKKKKHENSQYSHWSDRNCIWVSLSCKSDTIPLQRICLQTK